MAKRRMLSKDVTDSDKFLNLSASAQALYLHLLLSADDDGLTGQVQISLFKAHATSEDFESLKRNGFIIAFDDGVIAISQWLMQNKISPSKYEESQYIQDKSQLEEHSGVYCLAEFQNNSGFIPEKCQPESGNGPESGCTGSEGSEASLEKEDQSSSVNEGKASLGEDAGGTYNSVLSVHDDFNLDNLRWYMGKKYPSQADKSDAYFSILQRDGAGSNWKDQLDGEVRKWA